MVHPAIAALETDVDPAAVAGREIGPATTQLAVRACGQRRRRGKGYGGRCNGGVPLHQRTGLAPLQRDNKSAQKRWCCCRRLAEYGLG